MHSQPKEISFPIGVTLNSNSDDDDSSIIAYEFGADGWQEVRGRKLQGRSTKEINNAFSSENALNIAEVWLEPGDGFLFGATP